MQVSSPLSVFGTARHLLPASAPQHSAGNHQPRSLAHGQSANMTWDEVFDFMSRSPMIFATPIVDQGSSSVPPFSLDNDHIHTLEREFCSNFKCCGRRLEDLHQLVQHFEDDHAISSSPYRESVITRFDDNDESPPLTSSSNSSASSPITPVTPLDLHGARYFFGDDPKEIYTYEPPSFPHITATPPPSDLTPSSSIMIPSTEVTMDDPSPPAPLTVGPEEEEEDNVMDFEPSGEMPSTPAAYVPIESLHTESSMRSPSPAPSTGADISISDTRSSPHPVRPKPTSNGKTAPSSHKKVSPSKSKSKNMGELLPPGRPESNPHRKYREKAHKCPKAGCVKSYLNPNGLKYHMTKGTCVFAEQEISSDTDNNSSEL